MSKIIGLDCGHGLKTAGKQTPDGIKEWELNDKVRDKVVNILKKYDCIIINTDNDEGNNDESLTTRRTMYVNKKVDVFVSIHHNALNGQWSNATGVEIYTDKNPTSKDIELANAIYKNLPNYTGLKGRGIKKANFTVINQNQIPAVLVEGGFMDSNNDYKVITSDKGQEGYAKAVADGLITVLDLKKRNVSQPTITPNPTNTSVTDYLVKITTAVLNVRAGAGTNYKVNTTVKKGEVYTIIEENNGWGKLKSKAGWINLAYTTKSLTTIVSEYYPACNSKYNSLVDALKSIGVDNSFENRKKIAQKNNIKNYEGKAVQNNRLLDRLKAGKLIKI